MYAYSKSFKPIEKEMFRLAVQDKGGWETHDDKPSHTSLSKHAGVYILSKPS